MPAYSSQESFYKIAIMTAHGQENWNWYNFISQNKKPYETIKKGMLRRLNKHLIAGKHPCKVQALMMYDNRTNEPIQKIALSELQ